MAQPAGGLDDPRKWWDARDPQSFFRTVYLQGDDSLEGWVEHHEMTLPERTAREAEGAVRLAGITPADTILDCPCGYGRHSLFLVARGHRVIGVDRNPEFIALARRQSVALSAAPRPRFLEGDMRAIPLRSASCSVVLNLVLSFGFFETDQENLEVLQEFARVLRRGGRLLIHTDVNPARLVTGTYGDRPVRTLTGGGRLYLDERYDPTTKRLKGTWAVVEADGGRRSAGYSVRIYHVDEFCDMLSASGFRLVRLFGAFEPELEEYEPHSQEFIVLAERLS
jgi:SAM-dependent methyltransferase